MRKRVLVPIANGVEDIEIITIVDILRRAGLLVVVAAVHELMITTANAIKIVADKLLTECIDEQFDLIVLPGGMPGAEHLRDCSILINLLKAQKMNNKLYGAICASPVVVLQHHGLIGQGRATCYPTFRDKLVHYESSKVVVDGNCITSQGPGTAMIFALKLVELLLEKEKAEQIAEAIIATE